MAEAEPDFVGCIEGIEGAEGAEDAEGRSYEGGKRPGDAGSVGH